MKKILLFVIILLILTWPSGTINRPDVNADDFIFEPDSLGVAALMTMISVEEVVKPDDVVVVTTCNCKQGKVSYDGGRSLSTCPCGVNGGKCNCVDCPYNKTGEVAPPTATADNVGNYSNEYSIIKVTAPWCGPCKAWDTNTKPSFEANGFQINDYDYDSHRALVADALISTIPHFIIQTKVDGFYHHTPNDAKGNPCGVYGYNSSDFSVEKANSIIAELDKSIHPNKKDGLFYERQQKTQEKLNGKFWASKKEYIDHLRSHANHKNDVVGWPLEKLSVYELKAIHDDDHASKLGVLHGI